MSRKLLIVSALMLAGIAWGCRDAAAPGDGNGSGTALGQKYLFESGYVNFAWGYRMTGVAVDSLGHVIAYDHSFAQWHPADAGSLTCSELDEKYAVAETLAVIDRAVLQEKAALIAGAAAGPWSERVHTGADMGAHVLQAYGHDPERDRYLPVMLDLTGDFTQTNLAPEARALAAWLDSLVAAVRR